MAPLPRALAGHISGRRIAEALTFPFETVRRHVARMTERGLRGAGKKGQLSTPGGTLARLGEHDSPMEFARRFTSVVRAMQCMGAVSDAFILRRRAGSGARVRASPPPDRCCASARQAPEARRGVDRKNPSRHRFCRNYRLDSAVL